MMQHTPLTKRNIKAQSRPVAAIVATGFGSSMITGGHHRHRKIGGFFVSVFSLRSWWVGHGEPSRSPVSSGPGLPTRVQPAFFRLEAKKGAHLTTGGSL